MFETLRGSLCPGWPRKPTPRKKMRDSGADNDNESHDKSNLSASGKGNVESGSYNMKSGAVLVKSPTARQNPHQSQQQHPTAIVAPLPSSVEAKNDTTPKGVNPAFESDEVFISDDAASSLQGLNIGDVGRSRGSGNHKNDGSASLQSAMPTMSPKSELQQQQSQRYQSRAAVTLSSKTSRHHRIPGGGGGGGVEEEDEERFKEEHEKFEEERRKDLEFLMQIRHDLTTEFVGADGITKRDAETQTMSTGRILVTEMYMDDGGM